VQRELSSLQLDQKAHCSLSSVAAKQLLVLRSDGLTCTTTATHTTLCMCSITLSGNAVDTEGAKAIAFTAAQPSCALRKLCLDHAGLGHAGEKHIAAGLLSNSKLALTHFTGFRLGLVFMELGMPHQVS
jgi:hypothetical protein